MGEVVYLENLITRLDLDSAKILESIAEDKPDKVFVICWPDNGGPPTYHTNTADIPAVLFRLREFEHKFFNGDFD